MIPHFRIHCLVGPGAVSILLSKISFGGDGEEASLKLPSWPLNSDNQNRSMQARRTNMKEAVRIVHVLHAPAPVPRGPGYSWAPRLPRMEKERIPGRHFPGMHDASEEETDR